MENYKKEWSEQDNQFLIENFGILTYQQIADRLKRTYHGVQAQARKLGLRQYKNVKWTDEEKELLVKMYPNHSAEYCANFLDRNLTAIERMTSKLQIKKNWLYSYISVEGYRVLCDDRDNKIQEHRKVMEEKLGRKLESWEMVHHIDRNKLNNHPDNLEIMTRSEHMSHHWEEINKGKQDKI